MALFDLKTLLANNTYPGRGIVIGKSADGKNAMIAYFIMGRSENSRNRIFERYEGGMRTKAFDESKLSDPSLIIYNPFLETAGIDVITNGDQTDTVMDYIKENGEDGYAFEKSLHTREFEPDYPNYTPRISGILHYANGDFTLDFWKQYAKLGGKEKFGEFKKQIIDEINVLIRIEGLPKVEELNVLPGSFVNLEYRLPNGKLAKFLDDRATYLGTQLESEICENLCFGIAANMDFILVCTYGENGENPELVLYKKR